MILARIKRGVIEGRSPSNKNFPFPLLRGRG